jgi:hypothetical protein
MKFACILISLVLSASAMAAESDRLPRPNWSRDSAVLVAEQPGDRETLAHLYGLAREGQGEALLQATIAIDEDQARPEPARDRILFELATALGDFEAGIVGPKILEYLRDRTVLARVPHEEHPDMGVPLYNVRAAAAGALAKWSRDEFHATAPAKIEPFTDPDIFVSGLSTADAAEAARMIRAAADTLSPGELEFILLAAPAMDDPATAAVMIAELSPRLHGHPAVSDLMFELLDDRDLGASAAMVLGRSTDETVLHRLSEMASEDGPGAQRASLAIALFLAGEQQP